MFWSLFNSKDTIVLWDHKFSWTSEHLSASQLHHLLYSYDKLATDTLDRLDLISPSNSNDSGCPHTAGQEGQRDIYALLKQHAATDKILGELWKEVSTVPEWVDWAQIHRGQRLVYQFSGQILLGLMYKSLLGGMAAHRVVETLSRTGGFSVHVTRRRLLETLQHFIDVVSSPLHPGSPGFESTVRVRLLHAAVRRRLMRLESSHSGYFDVQAWGVPVNDLHCIGTVAVYSASIVYMALPRQGVFLSRQQTADYLALWRWVGYLLGTPVDWMATPEKAKAMMESIMVAEVQPSPMSRILANNILTAEAGMPPLHASREYLAAQAYRLNGTDLAAALGIDRPRLYYRILVWTQCLLLLCLSYSYPFLPSHMQARRDERFIHLTRAMIASHFPDGTKFAFQYVPRLGKTTLLGQESKPVRHPTERPRGRAVLLGAVALAVMAGLGVVSCLRGIPHHVMSAVMAQVHMLLSSW